MALTLLLLAVEVGIALFISDSFIRPFVGDVLVVVLIFSFLAIFLTPDTRLVVGVLIFSLAVEVTQYFDLVALLGLQDNRFMSVIMGRTFSWLDFVAYFTGSLICLGLRHKTE